MVKPSLDKLSDERTPLQLCIDEASQTRRALAEMLSAEMTDDDKKEGKNQRAGDGGGYQLEWCVAAFEAQGAGRDVDIDRARTWLKDWAPTRAETGRL